MFLGVQLFEAIQQLHFIQLSSSFFPGLLPLSPELQPLSGHGSPFWLSILTLIALVHSA